MSGLKPHRDILRMAAEFATDRATTGHARLVLGARLAEDFEGPMREAARRFGVKLEDLRPEVERIRIAIITKPMAAAPALQP